MTSRAVGKATLGTVIGVFLMVLGTARPGLAQTQPSLKPLPEPKRVQVGSSVPVSGGTKVGLVVSADAPIVLGQTAAYVTIPSTGAVPKPGYVCLEVSSQDGQYSALFSYDLLPNLSGVVRLTIEPVDLAKLKASSTGRVALLASLSVACERAEPTVYLVASWYQPARSDSVSLLLNSRLPTFVTREDAPSGEVPLQCASLDGTAVSYNLRCDIPPTWLSGTTQLLIQQRRGRAVSTLQMPVRAR